MEHRLRNKAVNGPQRPIVRILHEIADTAGHDQPTRAATAAVAARLLQRLLARFTQVQAN